jgi:hypothetical protein
MKLSLFPQTAWIAGAVIRSIPPVFSISSEPEQSFVLPDSLKPFLRRRGVPNVKQRTRQSSPGNSPHELGSFAAPTFEPLVHSVMLK